MLSCCRTHLSVPLLRCGSILGLVSVLRGFHKISIKQQNNTEKCCDRLKFVSFFMMN